MLGLIVRRLLFRIPMLLVASILVFLLLAFAADPLGDLYGRNPRPPESVFELRRRQLNLDKPLPQRYAIWASHFVRGDMGTDVDGRPVRPQLWSALLVTLRMVLLAAFLSFLLALLVGVISAVRQYSALDYTATFLSFLFISMPVFWLAALLKEFIGIRINNLLGRQVVFTIGAQDPNLSGDLLHRLGNYLGHLVLPTVALVAVTYAAWSRYQRASMLDVLHSDYIRLARAKGLTPRRVLVRHAVRTALIPLTNVVAIDVAALLGGAVITERVFAWKGMGTLLIDGALRSDVNLLLAWVVVAGTFVVLFNLLADILLGYLDPRIRSG